jgi:hypothetical protein
LKRLREGIQRKRPDKWKKNNWFLHHDNAPAHTSFVARQFLTSKNITVTPHTPPIRLTLPPATFSYSPRWNYGWKGVTLTWLRSSTQERKRLSTHSHLRTSRDAWNHGKHAGIAVYMSKWTTSKEIVETRSYSKKLFFMVKFPEFLGSPMYKCQLENLLETTFSNRQFHVELTNLTFQRVHFHSYICNFLVSNLGHIDLKYNNKMNLSFGLAWCSHIQVVVYLNHSQQRIFSLITGNMFKSSEQHVHMCTSACTNSTVISQVQFSYF